jgi:hypothetical protein
MYKPQICIVNHNYFAVITWFGTHIIMRGLKSSNFRRSTFKLKIQLFVFMKNVAKQLVLISKGILKLDDSHRKTLRGWIITYIRVGVRDVSRRLAHEAKAGEVACLALGLLILLWAGGVIAGEVEVTEGSTCTGYHLLELLLLLVPEAVLLLALALVARVVLVVIVVLVGGVELLPLGAVSDEVDGVTTLKTAPQWSPPLLAEYVQGAELSHQQGDLIIEMLLYFSSEAAAKEDKANSKADELIVLVGLATWPPIRVLVIKALLVREALWLGRHFLDSSWDFSLLNNFSVSRVAKSTDFSKVVIFIPHTESSRAYSNYLSCSLSE